MNKPIKLVQNTISEQEINSLINWLKTNPVLTKSNLTIEFEQQFAKKIETKYAVFVNSGSSANLAIIYGLKLSNKLKNNKIIVPAISWVTTVSPVIQLNLKPILCDCDKSNLGLDIDHLRYLIKRHNPAAIILVHVLGVPNHLDQIIALCKQYNIILIEDCCEAFGSKYKNKPLGSFGEASSFSMYYSHQISTIEGGMICTDNKKLYNLFLSIRGHGWDRDLDYKSKIKLRNNYKIDDFKALYTFYVPGFNLRSTDLQAFIGLGQLEKSDISIQKRSQNFNLYQKYLLDKFWKINPPEDSYISNMAYPLISKDKTKIIKRLTDNNIETRPLICGSIGRQPFWTDLYGETYLEHADIVHNYGFYIPNYPELTEQEIQLISQVINND